MAKVGRGHRFLIPVEDLERMYLVEKLSTREIGEKLGCSYDTVRVRLIEAGISVRSKSEAGKLWVRTPESNAKRSAAHKTIWDERGRTTEAVVLRLQSAAWKARRLECYERDGWRCQEEGCGVLCTNRNGADPKRWIQAHHELARRDGGGDELENLVTLCMSCHQRRERAGL